MSMGTWRRARRRREGALNNETERWMPAAVRLAARTSEPRRCGQRFIASQCRTQPPSLCVGRRLCRCRCHACPAAVGPSLTERHSSSCRAVALRAATGHAAAHRAATTTASARIGVRCIDNQTRASDQPLPCTALPCGSPTPASTFLPPRQQREPSDSNRTLITSGVSLSSRSQHVHRRCDSRGGVVDRAAAVRADAAAGAAGPQARLDQLRAALSAAQAAAHSQPAQSAAPRAAAAADGGRRQQRADAAAAATEAAQWRRTAANTATPAAGAGGRHSGRTGSTEWWWRRWRSE